MSTANSNRPNASIIVSDRHEGFALSAEIREEIHHEMSHYDDNRAASIEALKIVQKHHGWVPDGACAAIGEILGVPGSDIEGVATFYNMIFRRPVGKYVIKVCDSIGCFLNDYEALRAALIQKLNIQPGQTTADGRFTLLPICCLGACDKAPVLMINDDTHFNVDPSKLDALLEQYR